MSAHTSRVRVRYAETDAMGVVHHSHFFAYFEAARIEYLRAAGADYRALEAEGYLAPVLEARCQYRAPAYFDDVLLIETRLVDVRRVRFGFAYRVRREGEAALLAEGHTAHVWLDARSRRPIAPPPQVRGWTADDPGPPL
jgi:acyl-CoA thioester hydrolase